MSNEATDFPGWPGTMKDISYEEWKVGLKQVPMGTGLFCSDKTLVPESPPHPEFVKEWRRQQNASVSTTAQHFGLSPVQVLEATGRNPNQKLIPKEAPKPITQPAPKLAELLSLEALDSAARRATLPKPVLHQYDDDEMGDDGGDVFWHDGIND